MLKKRHHPCAVAPANPAGKRWSRWSRWFL
jgi:hypothetical protein